MSPKSPKDSPTETLSVRTLELDVKEENGLEKQQQTAANWGEEDLQYDKPPWYLKVPFATVGAPPPKGTLEDAPMIPEVKASLLSLITFGWMTHILALGYARPLCPADLYKLPDNRSSKYIADKILASFDARVKFADSYNDRLAKGEIKPGIHKYLWWTLQRDRKKREKELREKSGKKTASLVMAMNDSVKWWFWSGGLLKLYADTAQVTSPLVSSYPAIIKFAQQSNTAHIAHVGKAPPLGKGIGLAILLLVMQLSSSICTHHFYYRSISTGVLLRGGLITAIYNRALRLTSGSRSTLTNGKLVNHISTDVSRIDFCCGYFHMAWTAPVQLCICLVLLLRNLGPSALAGFAFFIICTPLQGMAMKKIFGIRQKSMRWTDKRAKLLQELLGGMKIIKFFAWEQPFLDRIAGYRSHEISYVRSLILLRSANNAVAFSLPVLASVLSFVVYSVPGRPLDPTIIFTSLTLFQLLRLPLLFMPISYSSIADALNATSRLHDAFTAEVFGHVLSVKSGAINPLLSVAVDVQHAAFSWDAPPSSDENKPAGKKKKSKAKKKVKENKTAVLVTMEDPKQMEERIFKLLDIDMKIPRGQLCAIVGAVGSGKSLLIQGLTGEMRRTSGSVTLGGSIGYCPQIAWIQNATIRENVCFGRPFDEHRYWAAIRDSSLEHDLELLPNGDMTEVGEKEISRSGGQKQRLNICRAIYSQASILIFDDPLSALDAHVGKSVFHNVLQKNDLIKEGTTRILVTHALHFLPQVDYIYNMVDGQITERGTYKELMEKQGAFASYVRKFGGDKEREEGEESSKTEGMEEKKPMKSGLNGTPMMQAEERNTGAVSGAVYAQYLKAAHGRVLMPLLALSAVFMEATSVMSSYWLVYWQEYKWHKRNSFYMIIYACLGVGQAIGFFSMGAVFAFLTYFASKKLHNKAISHIMHAPMSFFDTTPLGRIMNRFSKDVDVIDNLLGDSLRMFFSTFAQIMGAIILISIILPYFLVPVFCVSLCYYWFAIFYRTSARELKRLDSLLRSSLYSHFSESLSGLATIRAYGESDRFRMDNEKLVDVENRAYWLTTSNQRWLGIRLDLLGILLTFFVALLTVAARFRISPSQTGVALSCILLVQQSFAWMIRQSAEVENNMNGVERILHYANSVEQEAPNELPDELPDAKPPASWPAQGKVEFKNVVFQYRPNLPSVLKNISPTVSAGEKIGSVGRTGAGKSSIMIALYRLVELTSGSIFIDGVDLAKLGLDDVRRGIAIIPQDPILFSGTLRSNLDPFGVYDDDKLWDALRRSYLVEQIKEDRADLSREDDSGGQTSTSRFTLDTVVEDDGGNLSVGQRSLVSLARALLKNSRVIVLDEATASVEYKTDAHIQDTIAKEFKETTILCIAHRLRTIMAYDRICVMDVGEIAEFDTPLNLYQQPDSIFRGMCERSNITLDEIRYAVNSAGRNEAYNVEGKMAGSSYNI